MSGLSPHCVLKTAIFKTTLSVAAILAWAGAARAQPRVLAFTKTVFVHPSIPSGASALLELGRRNGFTVDTTGRADAFTDANLRRYQALVFLNNCGEGDTDIFTAAQKDAFQRYIRAGGGFAGIHCPSHILQGWSWYTDLVGAVVDHHTAVVPGTIRVTDRQHLSTAALPETWNRTEEWYVWKAAPAPLWKRNPSGVKVLAYLQEHAPGVKDDYPIAWYHEYDGGRAWYTALGHTPEAYSEPLFLAHILGGIRYAMGAGAVTIRLLANPSTLPAMSHSAGLRDLAGRLILFPGARVLPPIHPISFPDRRTP